MRACSAIMQNGNNNNNNNNERAMLALHPLTTRHVSVIGAGAAGLVAARELRREGHSVVVFERGDQVGGTWVYTPKADSGLSQTSVHSSLYQSLRTNLPRECMGFRDYPFIPKDDQGRDLRQFPGHLEVLMYLQDFTNEFEIGESVRFETEVVHVRLEEEKWKIKSRKRGKDDNEKGLELDDIFDAVVVCNGHYTQPRVADILGINEWPGKQMHGHNYSVPKPFRGQGIPFPMFELQSKWIAGVLSSRIELPSQEKMMEDVSKQYTLNMEWTQFHYNDWLAALCGCPTSEDWRVQMFYANRENRRVRRDSFRDE